MIPKQLLTLLALLASLPVFSAEYRHPERKFSFHYNETKWEVVVPTEQQKKGGQDVDRAMASLTLVNLQRKEADDKYRARFSVVVDPSKKLTGTSEEKFKAYQKHALDFMKGQRFHVLSDTVKPLAKIKEPAYEIVANQRDFGLKFRQMVFLKGEEAYLLTAAARTAKFPEYEKEIQGIFDSFQFQ